MKIILASQNKGKIKEFKEILKIQVFAYTNFIPSFFIEENGNSFKQNAFIKLRAVERALKNADCFEDDMLILADDSGVSIKDLANEPNIYSARYAGINASDKQNNEKVIKKLKEKKIKSSKAFYTACLAFSYKEHEFSVHGKMHGEVCTKMQGSNGFGYDSIFVPKGFDKTLASLDENVKKKLSHRAKALKLVKILLESFE